MLTILAGFAEEESRSVSENMKWRIRKNFQEGLPWDGTILGYRFTKEGYVVEPEEAETVKRIFREYLAGKGTEAISNGLNSDGVKTRFGNEWYGLTVGQILRNETYTGNLLLQKTYRADYRTKKKLPNDGVLPRYYVTAAHEAIISEEDFKATQAEIERRAQAKKGKVYTNRYPYSSLIICSHCGKHYHRKVTHADPVWICPTYNRKGKAACPSKAIPEKVLDDVTANLDFVSIRAEDGNNLTFTLADGTEMTDNV